MFSREAIFVNHFLERRLKRVPIEVLKNFLQPLKDTETLKTQRKIIEEILAQYSILKQNRDFVRIFNNFVRDYLLSARESEYLLKIKDNNQLIDWIRSWRENRFVGQNNYFSMHIYTKLEEKFLRVDEDEIPFPTEVVLLVAFSKTPKQIPSGLELVEFYPTTEFEIVFRKDMDLVEIRGQNRIIKDFVFSAILDSENPLSMSSSIFIGERKDTQSNSIVRPARIISIEKLRTALNGTYTSVSAPVAGTKTSRMKADLDELYNLNEETEPNLKIILEDLLNNQDRSRISFKYQEHKYSFDITKSGGLFFMKYAPEEVITYVLGKIKSLAGDSIK